MRILIVDDEPDHRRLLALAVRNHFDSIHEAENGMDAIEQARAHQPDVILMDVQMPGMDGFTALERLKGDEATAHIPVVMISAAYTRTGDLLRGLRLGAIGYIKKPFNIFELPKMLEGYAMEAKKKAQDGPGPPTTRSPQLTTRKEPYKDVA